MMMFVMNALARVLFSPAMFLSCVSLITIAPTVLRKFFGWLRLKLEVLFSSTSDDTSDYAVDDDFDNDTGEGGVFVGEGTTAPIPPQKGVLPNDCQAVKEQEDRELHSMKLTQINSISRARGRHHQLGR